MLLVSYLSSTAWSKWSHSIRLEFFIFEVYNIVSGISPGVKAAGAYGWRPTTLVVPNVKKIRGLNLPGTPWATSACCGMTFTFTFTIQFKKYVYGITY